VCLYLAQIRVVQRLEVCLRQTPTSPGRVKRRHHHCCRAVSASSCGGLSGDRSPLPRTSQPSHPEPADATPQKVVREIRPRERRAQNRPADEGASQEFQEWGMPQLQKLQTAGEDEHRDCNHPRFVGIQKDQKAPEYLVEHAAKRVVHPVGGRSGVELAIEAKRHDDQQRGHSPEATGVQGRSSACLALTDGSV
jgi:hypothetical protein